MSLRRRETEKKPLAVETNEGLGVDPGTGCLMSLVASNRKQAQPSWAEKV